MNEQTTGVATSPEADNTTEIKKDIRRFWGAVYREAYTDNDTSLTSEELMDQLVELEDMFRVQLHGAVLEMPINELKGKQVLEIGPGAGGHSALFAKYGAIMTSADITPERAMATQQKFDLMGEAATGCKAINADAENLPFPNDSFDIVYSNGVLHCTDDTEKAFDEALRVLKPGGLAVIMVYAKDSFHYWFNLWFCVGLLQGKMFTDPNWAGPATEWIGHSKQTVFNPYTRVYTKRGIYKLFGKFTDVRPRKEFFFFYLIPKLGRFYRRWQIRRYGEHPGGKLVYGEPWPNLSPLERWLGKYMGFAWFVSARKPVREGGGESAA